MLGGKGFDIDKLVSAIERRFRRLRADWEYGSVYESSVGVHAELSLSSDSEDMSGTRGGKGGYERVGVRSGSSCG